MDYSQEDVINLFADTLGIKADIITKELEGLENPTKEDIKSVLGIVSDDRFSHVSKQSKARALKQAKREERKAAENELSEALGIDKMSLSDQIAHIKETQLGSTKDANEKKELTKEDILKHPHFNSAIESIKQQLADKDTELSDLKTQHRSSKVNSTVKAKLRAKLNELKADLGEGDSAKRKLNQFEKLAFIDNKFDLDDSGNIIIIDDKGEPIYKNDKFDKMTLEDVVKESWVGNYIKDEVKTNPNNTNPRENSFNKNNFNYKDNELSDPDKLYTELQNAKKEGNDEKVKFLKDELFNRSK